MLIWLGVQVHSQNIATELSRATLISARRGQAELDILLTEGLLSRKQHAERWAAFQRQIIAAEQILRAPNAEAEPDHVSDLAILTGQKTALMDAARRGIISSETAEARAAELDTEIVAAALPDKGAS